ncbi:MAG TPA: LCP family protein [Candidatus Polarisedimenticolia bacterium]|nr:LCP family protein [Candidatus Polarisedimenticolia bacterium]
MQAAHEARQRRGSPFVAAFLSLLFPGLGHAYLGAYQRALGLAAPVILGGALTLGIAVRLNTLELAGLAVQTWFLTIVFVLNLVLLGYRAIVIVDAWRVATAMAADARVGVGRPIRIQLAPIGVAGLLAVLLVMSAVHIAVARYDLLLARTSDCIFDPEQTGCPSAPTEPPDGSVAPEESSSPSPAAETPLPSLGTAAPDVSIPPWNGQDRLNILLIGSDEQGGGHNTDTLIVVSIDPATKRVAMFSLPRDTVDVPIPEGPPRAVFGRVYGGKINAWFHAADVRPDLFPGTDATRGYNALKSILGNLYGLDVKYYVEVNFDGFRAIVDALGGVTVNVQVPVVDDQYPVGGGRNMRVYIPSGIQHMNGSQALVYARSRKGSSDFDRGQRQQRILLSLRQQTDIARVLPKLDELMNALAASIRTDIPRELVPQLLGLANEIDTKTLHAYVFAPPAYGVEGSRNGLYILTPRVDRIRAAVAEAFTVDPALEAKREALATEAADVWVLNGSGVSGQASRIAGYLESIGITASAPNQKPDITGRTNTTIRVYNGAEARLPVTVEALQAIFGATIEPVADPTVRVDIIIITGTSTPNLAPPPLP